MKFKSERIIPLFVLVVIPALVFLSKEPYLSLPPLYSWSEYNNQIHFPISLTQGETPIQYIHVVLEYVQREEVTKIYLYSYYPYHLIGFDVSIPRNVSVSMPTSNCHPINGCTLNGFTMVVRSHLVSVGIISLVISLVYSFYPLKYRADGFFKKRGLRQAISEYELVKKILYIETPLFVFSTLIVYAGVFTGLPIMYYNTSIEQSAFSIAKYLEYALQYSVTSGCLWMLFHMIRKDFRYYLASALLKNTRDMSDNVEKLHWLITALHSYNKYLLRSLKLQIDTSKVYHRLVIESNEKVNDYTESISDSFDDGDKLAPIRRLSQIMKLSEKDLFLKQSLAAGIIAWGTLVAAIFPVVISVIGLFFHSPNH